MKCTAINSLINSIYNTDDMNFSNTENMRKQIVFHPRWGEGNISAFHDDGSFHVMWHNADYASKKFNSDGSPKLPLSDGPEYLELAGNFKNPMYAETVKDIWTGDEGVVIDNVTEEKYKVALMDKKSLSALEVYVSEDGRYNGDCLPRFVITSRIKSFKESKDLCNFRRKVAPVCEIDPGAKEIVDSLKNVRAPYTHKAKRNRRLDEIATNHYENVESILSRVQTTLTEKAKEYIRNDDVFHNFRKAGIKADTSPLSALLGFKLKHDVSLDDLFADYNAGKDVSLDQLDEKTLDTIIYLILANSMIKNRVR